MFSSFNYVIIIRRLCILLITLQRSCSLALACRACFISVSFSLLICMHSEFQRHYLTFRTNLNKRHAYKIHTKFLIFLEKAQIILIDFCIISRESFKIRQLSGDCSLKDFLFYKIIYIPAHERAEHYQGSIQTRVCSRMIKRVVFYARVGSPAHLENTRTHIHASELLFLGVSPRLGSCRLRIPFPNQPCGPRARHLSQTTAWLPTKLTFTTIFPINLQASAAT